MFDAGTIEDAQTRLLGRIAEQDQRAVAELYDQLAGVLYSLAARILGDAHEAEEAIQDVFVQIWQKAEKFDRTLGTPLHWALSITRHRCIDRLRSRQRRHRAVEAFEVETAVRTETRSSHVGLMGEDELQAIHNAFDELSTEERQAIELAFFQGFSHGEIADVLEQPLGTIKARIRRGMMKLRGSLEGHL